MRFDARHIRTMGPVPKVRWKCLGPFTAVQWISPYAYEFQLPESLWIHRVQPLSLLDPVVDDPLEGERISPPPSVEVDGGEHYQVSSVEVQWIYRNQLE